MAPIRIKIVYGSMPVAAELQSLVTDTLVPHATQYLSSILSVRPVAGDLRLGSNGQIIHRNGAREQFLQCGGAPLALIHANADLVVVVRVERCSGFMGAAFCSVDACGRPTSGQIRICDRALTGGVDKLHSSLIHEFVHILGFDNRVFPTFRDPVTMEPLQVRPAPPVYYTCQKSATGHYTVRWDLPADSVPPEHRFKHTFPGPIVRAIDARGLLARDCRCPIDATRIYTNEDIEYCLRHPNHCAVAVTSPTVKAAAREYYGCDSVEGQELENGRASCELLLESHWKVRTLKSELMNYITTETVKYVSPMTFALLQDSGWYVADFSKLSTLVPTANYGYKSGCDFVIGKCFIQGRPVDDRIFCRADEVSTRKCSPDALRIATCDAGQPHGVWARQVTQYRGMTRLEAYQYGTGLNEPKLQLVDYCPTYESSDAATCALINENSRCLDRADGTPECMPVACAADGRSYKVKFDEERSTCTLEGEKVQLGRRREYVCRDPAVICADWKLNHFAASSVFNSVPRAPLLPPGSSSSTLDTFYAIVLIAILELV